jgi:uncharacterized membrane protein YheB (UPF0754 family)
MFSEGRIVNREAAAKAREKAAIARQAHEAAKKARQEQEQLNREISTTLAEKKQEENMLRVLMRYPDAFPIDQIQNAAESLRDKIKNGESGQEIAGYLEKIVKDQSLSLDTLAAELEDAYKGK